MLPRVVWAEKPKNRLGFKIGSSYDDAPTRSQLVTDRYSSRIPVASIPAETAPNAVFAFLIAATTVPMAAVTILIAAMAIPVAAVHVVTVPLAVVTVLAPPPPPPWRCLSPPARQASRWTHGLV